MITILYRMLNKQNQWPIFGMSSVWKSVDIFYLKNSSFSTVSESHMKAIKAIEKCKTIFQPMAMSDLDFW